MKQFLNSFIIFCIGNFINFLSYIYPKKAKEIAYKFFSTPRAGRLQNENLPTILKQASFDFFELENHKFPVYVWSGNATKIILVHGWESNASRWELLIHQLQKSGSTIIALDGPAHGLSNGVEFNVPKYASFINLVVKHFEPSIIIGHSIGGSACLFHQHFYKPESIKKIILIGSPSDLDVLIFNFKRILGLNNRVSKQLENYFEEKFKLKIIDFSGAKMASTLEISGIVAHDTEDDVVSFKESQKIISSWKNAIFIETQGLGHSMHDEKMYQKIYNYLFEDKANA
ncbi:alpha/beta hydrolase [Flavobacterium sp. UBA6135]|uniref:alpha/beta hydrolase n=1 Tax=Flavobacterium sp. UBA6135 TaxID=1946553 RepID=UPI0025C06706|nr:alpha/beta hydrolase [Flavobacterium sp. UBA6135]